MLWKILTAVNVFSFCLNVYNGQFLFATISLIAIVFSSMQVYARYLKNKAETKPKS